VTHRPTTLKLYTRNCPHAVTLYEQGAPADRSIFHVGTAAHDILEACGKFRDDPPAEVARAVCAKLISVGRVGIDSEPPLPEADVFAGRDLALSFIERVGLPIGRAFYEVGLAFNADWTPGVYGRSWFQTRLDVAEIVEVDDEESHGTGLCASDYKSAWPTGAEWLDTIQAKAQAVGLWLTWPRYMKTRPDFIRRECINLRTGQRFAEDVWPEDDPDTLPKWQADIAQVVEAADSGERTPRPGYGCTVCMFVGVCEPAREMAAAMGVESMAPRDVATVYAAAQARADELKKLVKQSVAKGSVAVPGGVVGYVGKPKSVPRADAAKLLWAEWIGIREIDDTTLRLIEGFLSAGDFGVTQVKALAKALFPGRDEKAERAELVEALTEVKTQARFGVWPRGSK